ncbi:MAG TPA: hypothetical protein VEL47_07390 [Myxococcota bacterium]|nr:hypothetical protein [Myxococcota bacterium]
MKKIIVYNLFLFASFILLPTAVHAQDTNYKIRVFCYYMPSGKDAKRVSSITELPSKKLMAQGTESVKKDATFYTKEQEYTIAYDEYKGLWNDCSKQVGDLGTLFGMMASDAGKYETFAGRYRLGVIVNDDFLDTSLRFSDSQKNLDEILAALNMSHQDEKNLKEGIASSAAELKLLAEKVKKVVENDDFKKFVASAENADRDFYVYTAITVAGVLVAWWFFPILYAKAVELIFPFVYQALWGAIPAAWSPSYVFLYLPAQTHAAAWAYNNHALITAIGSTLGKLVGMGVQYLSTRGVKKEDIVKDIKELSAAVAKAK